MRKVLSFVLVLALVLSSFSMAFATTSSTGLSDISGNANEDAIQVAYDLGIVTGNEDGTFLPDKSVNRAEFAAMLTRALSIPDSALAGYTTTSFNDTTGYTWAVPYLAFCQSKGILLGDGNGNVMPGQEITVNQAMTMALRAIGYTANSSLLVGVWPSNYVSIAQNVDLYDDVAEDTTVNKASAAQIIYNLLTVQKVAVNTDGTTESLWDGDEDDEIAANLLNTNLGCEAYEDVILGDDYDYEDAIINITDDIGAFGTAYLNDDDELVAFTKDSTALTGSVNDDGDFEVGDVTYEFGDNEYTSNVALFANTDYTEFDDEVDDADVASWAAVNADDADTVTINAEISGKKIKDLYSVVAWDVNYNAASSADLADSDVQDDIADNELLGSSFVEDDDDAIDGNSFELVGVSSLEDIAEDDVVYVYADDDDDIRKVAVGTETVEGIVDELDDDDDIVTIGGTEYDIAATATTDAAGLDVDDDGIFYLDVNGEIYDFDGSGSTDTYAVVKASESGDSFDNLKVKLYTSDDSTTTYELSEDDARDIEWTTNSAYTITATTAPALVAGSLVGYALDSSGDIDTLNVATTTASVATFQSVKVLKINDGSSVVSYSIDSEAVVFTYDASGEYDVCDLADVDTGAFTDDITFILNDDDDVAALFINEADADVEDDAIYGVINKRTKTTNDDDDTVFKFTGFIDSTAFTYTTEDDTNGGTHGDYTGLAGVFGVYGIVLDASDNITKINDLDGTLVTTSGHEASGKVATGIVTALGSDNTIFTINSEKYTAADDAVVYLYDENDDEYTTSKLSAIDEDDEVALYDTKGDDADGIASVVIFIEN